MTSCIYSNLLELVKQTSSPAPHHYLLCKPASHLLLLSSVHRAQLESHQSLPWSIIYQLRKHPVTESLILYIIFRFLHQSNIELLGLSLTVMSNYLPSFISRPISHGADIARGAIGSFTWGPALSLSRTAVTSLLSRIERGSLIVIDESTGVTTAYGQKVAKETSKLTNGTNGVSTGRKVGGGRVVLTVRKESFWVRLALFADMGFAEAYMLGEVKCNDLTGFFEVMHP